MAMGLGSLACFGLAASCSGKPFTTGGGSGVSGNSSGGTTGGSGGESGGEAGESGSEPGGSAGLPNGGSAGVSPNGGSAGKPPASCDCKAGEYCQDATSSCVKCANFSRFQFGTPQKLGSLAQNARSERFARPAASGSALFYAAGAADDSKIFYTGSPLIGIGSQVTLAALVESGPLFVSGFKNQNLFFDRQQDGKRKLRMALWTTPATLTDDVPLPDPFNAQDSDDYSIAISPNTGHVYWMSTRTGSAELVWQPTSMSSPPPPTALDLKVKVGKTECARSGEDATPWVNLSGTLLLFRNPSLNEACETNDSGGTDLYAVPLNSDGEPEVAATPLASLNKIGGTSMETDPTLSSDACSIYFASDNGTGDYDLYKAPRN